MFHPTEIDNNTFLYHGDCLEVLPFLADRGMKADLLIPHTAQHIAAGIR